MDKKLIIFDCDGVLVDSEFVSCKVFSETLSKYGHHVTVEECIKQYTGINEEDCRQLIMAETGIHMPKDYWESQETVLRKAFETELTPLLQPVLDALVELGLPRCVASNSSRRHVIHCLETTNQLGYFEDLAIFSSQQVKRAKPAPDLFLHAAKEMGFKPQDCLVIEDSLIGANAAIAAGMKVFMFLGGTHARSDWYREKVAINNKPMHATSHALALAIREAL